MCWDLLGIPGELIFFSGEGEALETEPYFMYGEDFETLQSRCRWRKDRVWFWVGF